MVVGGVLVDRDLTLLLPTTAPEKVEDEEGSRPLLEDFGFELHANMRLLAANDGAESLQQPHFMVSCWM